MTHTHTHTLACKHTPALHPCRSGVRALKQIHTLWFRYSPKSTSSWWKWDRCGQAGGGETGRALGPVQPVWESGGVRAVLLDHRALYWSLFPLRLHVRFPPRLLLLSSSFFFLLLLLSLSSVTIFSFKNPPFSVSSSSSFEPTQERERRGGGGGTQQKKGKKTREKGKKESWGGVVTSFFF